jgi:hypothetical protein
MSSTPDIGKRRTFWPKRPKWQLLTRMAQLTITIPSRPSSCAYGSRRTLHDDIFGRIEIAWMAQFSGRRSQLGLRTLPRHWRMRFHSRNPPRSQPPRLQWQPVRNDIYNVCTGTKKQQRPRNPPPKGPDVCSTYSPIHSLIFIFPLHNYICYPACHIFHNYLRLCSGILHQSCQRSCATKKVIHKKLDYVKLLK